MQATPGFYAVSEISVARRPWVHTVAGLDGAPDVPIDVDCAQPYDAAPVNQYPAMGVSKYAQPIVRLPPDRASIRGGMGL
jgi:hypothetical protein